MTKTLDVYLNRDFIGHLTQNEHGLLLFKYDESWLNHPGAIALSHSLPLQAEPFRGKKCQGFFGGILPEEAKREQIAKNLGISAHNDHAMLVHLGGECAGAVTFMPQDQPLLYTHYQYRPLKDTELASILRKLPHRPLMAGTEGVRLSLAGAQDKIAVHVEGNKVSLPLDTAPSTHVLKPAIERFEGLVFNEAVCMKLAAAVGISTANVTFRQVEGIDYLLIERYDRHIKETPRGRQIQRLHQEDFCQALGIAAQRKYQSEGGPGLKQCFTLLREVSSDPHSDLQRFLDAVLFNVLIGNHDAHAKNFSFLYEQDAAGKISAIRFAPLYDLVSTVYYPELTQNMAMKLGGEYQSARLVRGHFETLADEVGLPRPAVVQRVSELVSLCLSRLDELDISHPIGDEVKTHIAERCTRYTRLLENQAQTDGLRQRGQPRPDR